MSTRYRVPSMEILEESDEYIELPVFLKRMVALLSILTQVLMSFAKIAEEYEVVLGAGRKNID